MGRKRRDDPDTRFARGLIAAENRGELKKSSLNDIEKYSINKIHEATGTHARTIENHLRHGASEVNKKLGELGSSLELNGTRTTKLEVILYGCTPGPLGIARRPLLDRQIIWRRTRPTPVFDLIEWRLNRPGIL